MQAYYGLIIALLLLWYVYRKRKLASYAAIHHIKKNGKESVEMENLAKEFIGQECIIYTITSNDATIIGTIKNVDEGAIILEDKEGQKQLINLEYVTRIREYPRTKKGKKKSVIMD